MPTSLAFSAVDLLAKTAPAKSTGSSFASILFLVVLLGVAYVLFLRPRSQAARRQRNTLMELNAGDEVLTGAGIFGTVLDVEPDRVTLETAPGTRITVVRSTIARRIEPGGNSVAEQNWQDDGHDGVAEAAGWHDPDEHDESDHDSSGQEATGDADTEKDEPEADGASDIGKGSGQ
jgi:preprotein translocase subunit YajC